MYICVYTYMYTKHRYRRRSDKRPCVVPRTCPCRHHSPWRRRLPLFSKSQSDRCVGAAARAVLCKCVAARCSVLYFVSVCCRALQGATARATGREPRRDVRVMDMWISMHLYLLMCVNASICLCLRACACACVLRRLSEAVHLVLREALHHLHLLRLPSPFLLYRRPLLRNGHQWLCCRNIPLGI